MTMPAYRVCGAAGQGSETWSSRSGERVRSHRKTGQVQASIVGLTALLTTVNVLNHPILLEDRIVLADLDTPDVESVDGKTPHRIPMGGYRWGLWRDAVLASAGFPAQPGDRRRRRFESVIVKCLQRYCLSDETQGFFGPVGWARVSQDDIGLDVMPGSGHLARRTTYLEWRAIDALASAIAMRQEVAPWLTPRVMASAVLNQGLLRLPFREPVRLSADEARMLQLCDGTRTVRVLTGDPADSLKLATLQRLRELGAVHAGFQIPVSARPERELTKLIERIAAPEVRGPTLARIAELVAAKDAVSATAGDAARVYRATRALAEVYQRIASQPPRHHGPVDGPLVYEETVRDADVRIGRYLTGMLAPPLCLLLDSAAWLVNAIASRYLEVFRHITIQARHGNGTSGVPLLAAAVTAMPELFQPSDGREPAMVAEVVAELQERWRRVLRVPPGVRRHQVTSSAIAEQAAREFAMGSPLWSGGVMYSLDIMIAASDPDAVARGECDLVLGRLRPATNVLENRVFSEQHPDPGRLMQAVEADLDRRVYAIPNRHSPFVTSRMCPPSSLLSPRYTYLSLGPESVAPPDNARVLPAAALTADVHGDSLVARYGRSGPVYDLAEMIGDMLGALVALAFRPLAAAAHQPRISIDALVIGRESWTFPASAAAWAFIADERERYAAARRWRSGHGLPERVFVRVPGEDQPTAIDFRSLPLVGLLAHAVRRAARQGSGDFTIEEALPDSDQLWLRDIDGNRYTAKLRLVAVDGRAR